MWPFKNIHSPMTASAAARLAMGLSPEDQAHDAVAEALQVSALPDGTTRIGTEAAYFIDVPENFSPSRVFIPEPTTPAELSPEYHSGLASRMIDRLMADETRLTDAIDAEQRQHETLMASLHAELAGVRKVREAYAKVGETLAEPSSDVVKPQRLTRGKRSSEKPMIIVDHAASE